MSVNDFFSSKTTIARKYSISYIKLTPVSSKSDLGFRLTILKL